MTFIRYLQLISGRVTASEAHRATIYKNEYSGSMVNQ